jgi:uncharacterized protein DUF6159
MNKLARSWSLMGASFRVIRQDKELVLFPLISGTACLLLSASFAVPAYLLLPADLDHLTPLQQGIGLALAFGFYFGTWFVMTYFNVALASCAVLRLRGGDPTFAYGMAEARSRIGLIARWALLAASVGLLLKAIEERAGFVGRIVSGFLGMAWSLASFFVVPIMVVDRLGPIAALKESAALFRKSWGERITAAVSFGLATLLFALPGVLLAAVAVLAMAQGGFTWTAGSLLAASLLWFGVLSLVMTAVQAVFQTALFLYVKDGTVAQGFDREALSTAYVAK